MTMPETRRFPNWVKNYCAVGVTAIIWSYNIGKHTSKLVFRHNFKKRKKSKNPSELASFFKRQRRAKNLPDLKTAISRQTFKIRFVFFCFTLEGGHWEGDASPLPHLLSSQLWDKHFPYHFFCLSHNFKNFTYGKKRKSHVQKYPTLLSKQKDTLTRATTCFTFPVTITRSRTKQVYSRLHWKLAKPEQVPVSEGRFSFTLPGTARCSCAVDSCQCTTFPENKEPG